MKKKKTQKNCNRSLSKYWWIGGLVLVVVSIGGFTLYRQNEKPGDHLSGGDGPDV